jgi:non-heme chloroperoxidase
MAVPNFIREDKSGVRSIEPGWSANPINARVAKWSAGIVAAVAVVAAAALAGLVVFGTASQPPGMRSVSDPMRRLDFSDLPKLAQFTARDGQALHYRRYQGAGLDVVVLIHGASGENSGMHAVAKTLNAGGATFYVPDLRGHGHDGRAGDIDYIGQLDDDLADLVSVIRPMPSAG